MTDTTTTKTKKPSKREAREAALEAQYEALEFPAPTAEQLAEADKLDAKSAASEQAKEDSFERCDTDGFLSQWAHGLTAQEARAKAAILRNGGYAAFVGLYETATGKRVPAKLRRGDYGLYWMVCDAQGQATGQFYPSGFHSRKLAAAGLEERWEVAPASAKLTGEGTGLSGTCWVETYRTDGGYPGAPEWKGGRS